ncbi:MAG: NYN domain-containing protein [Myxococcota bacterium]|jgi:uncharacterized protein (TIGR00288 family)|nr:NYN domain-containing protein [Myxococcota bacterium]
MRNDVIDMSKQVAFLVDGDNLTGQNWTTLIDSAQRFGYLAVARLYMDFQALSDGGLAARSAGFEPVHVLGKRSTNGYKSMVDVALATDAMAVLYENPNITTFIIGTGDADFIPLIRHWKRRGKSVVVMSNDAKLSNELRRVADDLVTFKGGRKSKKSASTRSRSLSNQDLREAILDASGATRLTDRETNLPLVRVDWLLEQLYKAHPSVEEQLPDENAIIELIAKIPELEPIDGKGRTYLLGVLEQDSSDSDESSNSDEDEKIFDIFAELCREVLPADGSWLPASSVLNEGKRLLEDGANLELPGSRPTGWFRNLLESTPGIELHTNEGGHMKVRRLKG